MKLLLLLLPFTLLLNSCLEDCNDHSAHLFTQTDLDWFAFETGDTVNYRDDITGENFYMICTSSETRIDSLFHIDEHCKGGGHYEIRHMMNHVFDSDFPFFENDHLKLYMELGTKEEHKTVAYIDLKDYNNYLFYSLYFEFDNETETIETALSTQPVFYKGLITINGKEYPDVYTLNNSMHGEIQTNAYYDTLYYNKQGFLKFISSQYGHRLEILE
jgi:hypothetical protein